MSTASTAEPPAPRAPLSRFLPGWPAPRPRIIAHRGLALDGAENTMRAFEDAVAAGADMIETDVRASRDGTAYTIHDETLERIAGVPRAVARMSDDQLAATRIGGEAPCTLEELLGSIDLPVNIDVKHPSAVIPTADAIARTGAADRVCVTSFSGSTASAAARAVRERTGILPTRSASSGTVAAFAGALALGLPQRAVSTLLGRVAALQIPLRFRGYPLVTERSLAAAHAAGAEIHVWTIDDPATMRALIEMGADGIVTNRSDVLGRLLGRTTQHGTPPAGEPRAE